MANQTIPDIEIKNLCKSYGSKKVLDGITFSVNRGEVMGFLGSNGAGKSTTMNILTGYISSDSGTVKICGEDILTNPKAAKRKIGYLPEIPPLYTDMTVSEYLNFVYDLKGVSEDRKTHIGRIVEKTKIGDVSKRLIKNLSKGYRQRVGLAQAIIGDPEVLILDEPTVGLDPLQIIEFRNIIKSLKGNHTVILSTHILQEVSAVCDKVTIINSGRVVVSKSLSELSESGGANSCTIRVKGGSDGVCGLISKISGAECTARGSFEEGTYDFEITSPRDIREEIFNLFAEANRPILEIKPGQTPIEELFARAASSEPAAALKGGKK